MFDDILNKKNTHSNELKENKEYHIKLIRLFYPKPKLIWEGQAKLYIQKNRKGEITLITPKAPISWAEYSIAHDKQDDGSYVCEDYQMIIN